MSAIFCQEIRNENQIKVIPFIQKNGKILVAMVRTDDGERVTFAGDMLSNNHNDFSMTLENTMLKNFQLRMDWFWNLMRQKRIVNGKERHQLYVLYQLSENELHELRKRSNVVIQPLTMEYGVTYNSIAEDFLQRNGDKFIGRFLNGITQKFGVKSN